MKDIKYKHQLFVSAVCIALMVVYLIRKQWADGFLFGCVGVNFLTIRFLSLERDQWKAEAGAANKAVVMMANLSSRLAHREARQGAPPSVSPGSKRPDDSVCKP